MTSREKKKKDLSAIARRGAAYAASSGSCLDALAPASGEGGVKKSDERRERSQYIAPRTYTITTYSWLHA